MAKLQYHPKRRVFNSCSKEIRATAVSVGTIATKLPATPLSGREVLSIYNNSANIIYIGHSAVTVSTGRPIQASGGAIDLDVTDDLDVYAISTASSDVRILELA